MPRRFFVAAALLAVFCPPGPLCAMQNDLVPEATAARHGLTRPWFAQVELDSAREHVRSVILYEGVLYVQTDAATVHAIDAETGKTLWSKQVGLPERPEHGPGCQGRHVGGGQRFAAVRRQSL